MFATPAVVVLDVNETLSDMSHLGSRMDEVGAPRQLLALWFAATLRDGFALAAAGADADFTSIAATNLRVLLARVAELHGAVGDCAEYVLSGLGELPLHADVAPALQRVRDAGIRTITLGNGSAQTAEALLDRANLRALVERCLSVTDAGRWKPAARAYQYAAEVCRVSLAELALVAVHPWDTDGAKRAGLSAAWVNRDGGSYPTYLQAPDVVGGDLLEVVETLIDP